MKKQKRYTVGYKPTGAEKILLRAMGVFHAVFGTIFAIIAATIILPSAWPVGLLFLSAGLFFAVNGVLIALGKDGLLRRSYQVETEDEIEASSHVPVSLDAKERLEQLESLRSAGLITEEEYRQKRQEIIRGL